MFFPGRHKIRIIRFLNNNWLFFFVKNAYFPLVSCHALNKLVFDRHITFMSQVGGTKCSRLFLCVFQEYVILKWKKVIINYFVITTALPVLYQKGSFGGWDNVISIKIHTGLFCLQSNNHHQITSSAKKKIITFYWNKKRYIN